MASFNKITIVGNLGRDPELRYSGQGTAVCKLSVATTDKQKREGETQDVTTWFRATIFGRQAELAGEYLKKGSQVYLEGRVRLEEYADKEGNRRTSLEVTVSDVQFLGKKEDGQSSGKPKDELEGAYQHTQRQQAQRASAAAGKSSYATPRCDEDDIPFNRLSMMSLV